MTTEDTHESTDGAAAQQQCPASGDTDSPREDVPTAEEGGAPGDEDGGQLFVGKILKHPYRKYRCKENDSVVTVCRKLKISEVKEVFELNRRRLADVEHFRQWTENRKGHVSDSADRLPFSLRRKQRRCDLGSPVRWAYASENSRGTPSPCRKGSRTGAHSCRRDLSVCT